MMAQDGNKHRVINEWKRDGNRIMREWKRGGNSNGWMNGMEDGSIQSNECSDNSPQMSLLVEAHVAG